MLYFIFKVDIVIKHNGLYILSMHIGHSRCVLLKML